MSVLSSNETRSHQVLKLIQVKMQCIPEYPGLTEEIRQASILMEQTYIKSVRIKSLGENMSGTIMNKKKTKPRSKILIFGFFIVTIISAVAIYFVFFRATEWLTQKAKTIEIGKYTQISELVNLRDDVLVSYHPKPKEPYSLGKLDITFLATKGEVDKEFAFTYTVVDTTVPVIEKKTDAIIAIGQEFKVSDYVKVTDNSGEDLISKVDFGEVSTATLGDFKVDLSVKDSSGNEGKLTLQYSVVDFTALAPNLPGTKKVMQFLNGSNRVTYIAEEGNPYGVKTGLYVGEFRKEVTFEGIEVGGVVLIPKVVEKLLADKDGKAIFIPADISEINNKDTIELSQKNLTSVQGEELKNYLLEINTNGNNVSISNPIKNNTVLNTMTCDQGCTLPEYVKNGIGPFPEDTDLYHPQIWGNFYFQDEFQNIFPFGQKLTETKNIFALSLNMFVYSRPMQENDFLKIGNSIVFLKDLD
jgi:hypothetical protein